VKRIFAIILLICLSLTILGYHFVFNYQITLAKTQMKKELLSSKHDNDIVLFEFTQDQMNELEWENSHEFHYHANMYDVISKTNKNGNTIIRCVSDKKETALIKYYLKVNRENHTGDRRIAGILELSVTPFIPIQVLIPAIPLKNVMHSNFSFYASFIPECFHMVITPPPEAC